MIIKLTNGGESIDVEVPLGSDAGVVRTLTAEREEIGAPSSYTLAMNGRGIQDSEPLTPGCVITFRQVEGGKGC